METKKHVPNERTEQSSRKRIHQMETSNIPNTEFKTVMIRMLKEIRGRVDELRENFNKEIKA